MQNSLEPKKITRNTLTFILSILLITGILLNTAYSVYAITAAEYKKVYNNNNLVMKPDGSFSYISVDTKRTTNIGYETIGVTIHDSDANGAMKTDHGSYARIDFAGKKATSYTGTDRDGNPIPPGLTVTYTEISAAEFKQACDAVNPNLYNTIVNGTNTVWGNAIMGTTRNGISENNSFDFSAYNQLMKLYGWKDPTGILSHYNKLLRRGLLPFGDPEDSDTTIDTPDNQEFNYTEFSADYYTWHIDNTGTYDIGEGIPSGKTVENHTMAYGWEGGYGWWETEIKKRTYTIKYKITVKYEKNVDVPVYNPDTDEIEIKQQKIIKDKIVTGEISKDRSTKYYYIPVVDIKKLSQVKIDNNSYGTIEYAPPVNIQAQCVINNKELEKYMEWYEPIDNQHIKWPDVETEVEFIVPDGDEHMSFKDICERPDYQLKKDMPDDGSGDPVCPYQADYYIGPVESWNDTLIITTPKGEHVYMDRGNYSGRRIAGEVEKDFYDNKWGAPIEYDGYNIGDAEMTALRQIPVSKENGKYDTTLTATYTRITPPDDNKVEYTKSAAGTAEDTKEHPVGKLESDGTPNFTWKDTNEPIVVHTPVISPVKLYDDTGSTAKEHISHEPTQSIQPVNDKGEVVAWNKNLDSKSIESYNLLLDGTYTLNFEPYKWLDSAAGDKNLNNDDKRSGNRGDRNPNNHTSDPVSIDSPTGKDGYDLDGYGYGAPSKYDEFVQQKKVRFPFDVAVINNGNDNGEKYYSVGAEGYTEWIVLSSNTVKFYIPTWAVESSSKFGANAIADEALNNFYAIEFDVEAKNANGNIAYEDLNNSDLSNYHARFRIPVNVSGVIYDFKILGVNDRDQFYGYSKDLNESVEYSFTPSKQEKRAGNKNRFGNDSIRYTIDGLLTKNWSKSNILPLAPGSSNAYDQMGALWKGSRFTWSVKTIANLSDKNDYLKIRPRFRYINKDGSSSSGDAGSITDDYDDIKIYYTDETGKFIEYIDDTIATTDPDDGRIYPVAMGLGETQYQKYMRDINNVKQFSFNNEQFFGAWYEGDTFVKGNSFYPTDETAIKIADYIYKDIANRSNIVFANDIAYTIKQYLLDGGKLNGTSGINTSSLKSKDATSNIANNGTLIDSWKNKKEYTYSMSDITSTSATRVLSGNCDYLERNQDYIKTDNNYSTMKDCTFNNGQIKAAESDSFRSSMQTWYGQYQIPEKLYVCDSTIEFNIKQANGGTKIIAARLDTKKGEEGYVAECDINKDDIVDIYDYADTNELSDNSPIWKKDGYLVLNFDIIAYNCYAPSASKLVNEPVLRYNAGIGAVSSKKTESDPKTNMWDTEGYPGKTDIIYDKNLGGTTESGDPNTAMPQKVTIPLIDGDIALIDLRFSLSNKYDANLFLVN